MAYIWHKTNFLGVRYREHAKRKHGDIRRDRCFSIRYKVEGKDREEVVGWSSEGITPEKAFNTLSQIRENIRKGVEPQSIAAMRRENEERVKEAEMLRRSKEYERITFSDFWKTEYLPSAEATKTFQTMNSERGWYRKWIRPAIGDIPLVKISISILESLMLKIARTGKRPATIRNIMAVISQVWNKAAERGLLQGENPTLRLKTPREDNKRERFLNEEEARELLSALAERSQNMHDIALTSLFCGLRAGEVHSLTWGDLDMEKGSIHVRDTKNKLNRHAFMTQEVREMLERRRGIQAKSALVFPGIKGQKRQWVSDTFSRTVDAIGLNNTGAFTADEKGKQIPQRITDARQRVVFHTLRHTFASWLVIKGTPLFTVGKLMGHTTLEMTQRYSHLAPDTLRKAAMALEGQLEISPPAVLQFRPAKAS